MSLNDRDPILKSAADAPGAPQPTLEIKLFGLPQLTYHGRPLLFRAPQRALLLLAFLVVERREMPRKSVAFALWPDDDAETALANLRRHLALLEATLPQGGEPWFRKNRASVAWTADPRAKDDVSAFLAFSEEPTRYRMATRLYSGPFFETSDAEWVVMQRERLLKRQQATLETLVARYRQSDNLVEALACAQEALRLDPFREDLLREVMVLRHANGDRTGALDDYRHFSKRTHEELDAEPLPETHRTFEAIAADVPAASVIASTLMSRTLRRPWLVPDAMRSHYFTGRERALAELRRQLMERHRVALSGLGGVGKTQTAIEYAVRHRDKYPDGVFWINAETESGLTSGFVEIAKALRLSIAASSDHGQVVRAVLEYLNATSRWLLIFDNVDDRGNFSSFFTRPGNGHVLITSRDPVYQEIGITRALEITDFESDEAVHFLLTRTSRDGAEREERAAAAELAEDLGNFPLALEQAAAYITETNASFADYLSSFRKRRVAFLELSQGSVSRDSVAVTWAANFEAVKRTSPAAADVLLISAFLAPDAIPFELFYKGLHALGNPIASAVFDPEDALAIGELLRPLTRYSLIRTDARSRTYGVHRLVQEVASAAIGKSELGTYVGRTIAALDAALPTVEYATWAECDRLVPHVVAIAGWVDAYDVQPGAAGQILNRAGFYLLQRGRYAEAEPLHKRALTIAERTLGVDDPAVARSLNNLANVYRDQGRYSEAEPLFARALAIRERAFGSDHLDVATSLNNLALVHLDQGRYAEAERSLERALAIRESSLGPRHPELAHGLNNLGVAHWSRGRYVEALSLYERALAMREQLLDPTDPDLAASLSNVACVYLKQGRYSEAIDLHKRALEIWERTDGPDHPHVASSLDNLAETYIEQGRYAEAQPLHERALAIWERAVGPDHRHVAYALDGLGRLYLEAGRRAEAESAYGRALAIRERALGPDHPEAAESLAGLAAIRKDEGHDAEAVALLEQALAIKERTLAADHPALAEIRSTLDALRAALTPSGAPGADVV